MRRNLLVILMLVLAISLTACGQGSESNVSTAPETEDVDVAEETAEEPQDEEANVEEVEETEVEEVEEEVAEETEDNIDAEDALSWPNDFLENVPVFEGKIYKITEKQEDVHIYIGLEDVKYEEAVAYVESLEEAGFTEDSNSYISEGTVNYKGNDKDGNFVKFHWSQNGYGGVDMIKN